MRNGAEVVDILGVRVVSARLSKVLEVLASKLSKRIYDKPFFVVTVNSEFMMLAQEDEEFRKILNEADLALADGMGLKLARVKNIVPGRKLVEELLKLGTKVFFLGGREGVSRAMPEKYGGEWDEGEKKIRTGERESLRILNKINEYKPDLLLVAYGAPWQEKWLNANRHRLKAKVVMGVGGVFDYLTGKTKLPPELISGIGLEWLWRLVHEPWRWRRQVKLLKFVWLVLKTEMLSLMR